MNALDKAYFTLYRSYFAIHEVYFGVLICMLVVLVLFLLWRSFLRRFPRFPAGLRAFFRSLLTTALAARRGDFTEARPFLAIVKRELLTSLRLRRTYALLVVSVGLIFAAVLSRVPTLGGNRADQAGAAALIFTMYATALYGVGWIFVPLLAGPAISMEHQRHTIEMLSVTMIGPRSIVLGKLVNVLGVYLLVAVATMPVIGVLFFFTGVGLGSFTLTLIETLFRILIVASVGLLCSAVFHRNTVVAIGATYLMLAFLTLFPWPLGVIAAIVCLRKAAAFVHRPPSLPRLEMPALIKDPARLQQRRQQWPYYLIDPLRPRKPIPDASNPMFAKENRTGLFRQGSWRIRVFYGYMMLFVFIPFFALEGGWARSGNTEIPRALFIETVLILLMAPAAISASFAKEYEIGNLDMLRMTTLRPRQIVLGKFLSAAALIAPLVLASVAGMVLMMPATGAHHALPTLGMGYASMLVTLLFALSVAAAVSVFARQTTVALVAGYALNIALLFGIPATGGWLLAGDDMVMIPMPLSILMHGSEYGINVSRDLRPWLLNLSSSIAVAGLLLAVCVIVFSRRWMQDR